MFLLRKYLILSLAVLCLMNCISPDFVQSQTPRIRVPSEDYRRAISVFNDGDFEAALKIYQRELRGCVKFGQNYWIDVICYYAMIGECYFQMGDYAAAFENYDLALKYYLNFNDWLKYVDFSKTATTGSGTLPGISPWGESTRGNAVIRFPDSYKIRVDFEQLGVGVNQSGELDYGIGYRTEYYTVYAVEVVEAMALAIRRRGEILGPLGKFDRLNEQLLQTFRQRPCQPNHWSGAWIDLCCGLTLVVQGKDDEAHPFLDRSLSIMGATDHPLTATGLLELGRIAMRTGDYDAASDRFYEASIAAYHYANSIVLEETFRMFAASRKMADPLKPCPLLIPALEWVVKERFTMLQFSLNMLIADDMLAVREFQLANNYLSQAWSVSNRRALRNGRHSGYWNYLSALTSYAIGDLATGDMKLQAAMDNTRHTSLWINQINILEALYRDGNITTTGPLTPRTAMALYEHFLRDPTAEDWKLNPLEALTVVSIPHPDSFERWFFLAIDREDVEKAFEIAELTRRHRFQSTLPFGSRLISLRLLLEAPDRFVAPEFQLAKNELSVEIPEFAELSAKSRDLHKRIGKMSLVTTDKQQSRALQSAATEWDHVTQQQEGMLRLIAMGRTRSPNIFPPFKTFAQFREELPVGTVVLMFFESNGEYYGFLIGKEQLDVWRIANPERLRNDVAKYLRSIGMVDVNRVVTPKDLAKEDWKKLGQQLFVDVLGGGKSTDFKEMVIVPDGFLWYLPFETLHVEVGKDQLRPLIGLTGADDTEVTIRYAPTAALALPYKTTGHIGVATSVFLGRLPATDKTDAVNRAFDRMKTNLQNLNTVTPDQMVISPSLMAKEIQQLVVLHDISGTRDDPYGWMPLPAGKNFAKTATLSNWMILPWGAPRLLILPGFHTAAEDSLKRGGEGEELFFALTALQSCGVESILLTRWRPGGRSSFDFTTEFLKNLGEFPAGMAMRKAIFKIAGQDLDLDDEPRVKLTTKEKDMKIRGNHPFFWGAFMLCDRGEIIAQVEETPLDSDENGGMKIIDPEEVDNPDSDVFPEDVDVEQLLEETPGIEIMNSDDEDDQETDSVDTSGDEDF